MYKRILFIVLCLSAGTTAAFAQTTADYEAAIRKYGLEGKITVAELQALVQQRQSRAPSAYVTTNKYLGAPITQYDSRVSAYSPIGAQNKYTSDGGRVYSQDGTYLGKLNANRYDPESVANPYGRYGSPYSSTSINNPYSAYGSAYSPQSARNPYAVTPPIVVYPRKY